MTATTTISDKQIADNVRAAADALAVAWNASVRRITAQDL